MYVVGWGTTKALKPGMRPDKLELRKNLKQVKLPMKRNSFCKNSVKKWIAAESDSRKDWWYFNSTTQFCAGDITGQKDTCVGDSGAPGMVLKRNPVSRKWRWFQVGIVSWGVGCAQKGEVGYYTKVSAYVDWIDDIIKT